MNFKLKKKKIQAENLESRGFTTDNLTKDATIASRAPRGGNSGHDGDPWFLGRGMEMGGYGGEPPERRHGREARGGLLRALARARHLRLRGK